MRGLDSQRKDRGSQSRLTHSLMVKRPGMAGGPGPNPNSEDIPNVADSIQKERCAAEPYSTTFCREKKKKKTQGFLFSLLRNRNQLKGLKIFHVALFSVASPNPPLPRGSQARCSYQSSYGELPIFCTNLTGSF